MSAFVNGPISLPPEDIWPVASVDGALTMDMNINEQRDCPTSQC